MKQAPPSLWILSFLIAEVTDSRTGVIGLSLASHHARCQRPDHTEVRLPEGGPTVVPTYPDPNHSGSPVSQSQPSWCI